MFTRPTLSIVSTALLCLGSVANAGLFGDKIADCSEVRDPSATYQIYQVTTFPEGASAPSYFLVGKDRRNDVLNGPAQQVKFSNGGNTLNATFDVGHLIVQRGTRTSGKIVSVAGNGTFDMICTGTWK